MDIRPEIERDFGIRLILLALLLAIELSGRRVPHDTGSLSLPP